MRDTQERRPSQADAPSLPGWYPILHPPRRPLWVQCVSCWYSALNELNQLRRAGWEESVTTPRRYRCGECAERDR